MPIDGSEENIDTTAWGRVPSVQALVTAFNSGADARALQDVGIDGMDDEWSGFYCISGGETISYLDRILNEYGTTSNAYLNANDDPAADNYHFFYGDDYDAQQKGILERYKKYNGPEGNSPTGDEAISSIHNFLILKILTMILP